MLLITYLFEHRILGFILWLFVSFEISAMTRIKFWGFWATTTHQGLTYNIAYVLEKSTVPPGYVGNTHKLALLLA